MDTARCLSKSIDFGHAIATCSGKPREAALDGELLGSNVFWHHAAMLEDKRGVK